MILIRKIPKKDGQETGLNCGMKAAVVAILMLFACSWYHRIGPPGPSYIDDCTTTSKMLVEGTYQNKNLYVQNPFVYCPDVPSKFCVVSVTINDTIQLAKDEFASSAFEIPLMDYHFNIGDRIRIVIEHDLSANPKLLNPEVYKLK